MPKAKAKPKKSGPTPKNKALYSRVKAEAKRKFDVWPSAYASAWLTREYKKRGGTYG
tara:strand:+ start:76 stop:246 length:171 start_codon:yes stop_codon:yes gene_type:complete